VSASNLAPDLQATGYEISYEYETEHEYA